MTKRILMALLIAFSVATVYAELPDVPSARVFASSELPGGRVPNRYDAESAFDGDPLTSWVEGVDGDGIGESVRIEFATPLRNIAYISVLPGFHDPRWWTANNRVREAVFRISYITDGQTHEGVFTHTFSDEMAVQRVHIRTALGADQSLFTVSALSVEIASVYSGDSWDDTCIAEIMLGGTSGKWPTSLDTEYLNAPPINTTIQQEDGWDTGGFLNMYPDGSYMMSTFGLDLPDLSWIPVEERGGPFVSFYEYGTFEYGDDGAISMTAHYRSVDIGLGSPQEAFDGPSVYDETTTFGAWGPWEYNPVDWDQLLEGEIQPQPFAPFNTIGPYPRFTW